MKKKSLGVNALLNSLQSLLNIIFPLVTFPYVSRTLTVSGAGKYNFASSIVSYFLLIAALGINTFAIREGAKLRDDRKKISEFSSKIFTINLISTAISYILLAILLITVQVLHKYSVAIWIFSLQIFFTTIGVNWLYTIFEEYSYITERNIVFKIISVILLFAFVRHSGDYLNYVAVTVFASTGSYVLNFFYAKRFCDIRLNFDFDWEHYLKPILIIFASNVAIQIYVNSDTTMLGFLKNNHVVGIYSVSVKVYSIIASLLASVLFVTIPRLSMLMGQKRLREYNALLRHLIDMLIVIIIPAMVGLIMLSKDVVAILGGRKYLSATRSLQILCLALIFKLLCSVFNECVLIPVKRESKSLIAFVVAAVLNIGLNFVLIPILSEKGAAITTVLAEFSAMAINLYYGRDVIVPVIRNFSSTYNMITVIIASIGIIATCLIVNAFAQALIIRLVLQVILSGLVYVVLLLIMGNETIKDILIKIRERV